MLQKQQNLWAVKCIQAPRALAGGGSVVADSLLVVTSIVGFCNCFLFCCALLCAHSSFAIILIGKRESWLLCLPGVS